MKKTRIPVIALLLATLAPMALETGCSSKHQPQDASSQAKTGQELYHCPMHPSIVSDHPGKCPICHMDLVRADEDEVSPGGGSRSQEVEGRASFKLSGERQQLIGVTRAQAVVRPLAREIRASGRVAFDPELFTAIEEYRQALAAESLMGSGSLREQSRGLLASARTKLKLMGLSDAQIRSLGSEGSRAMSLLLPQGKVWIYAEVFEYEVAGLKPGLAVEVDAPSVPGASFTGKVTSVSPILSSQTRTVRVRAEVPDPQGSLRPDTFVNVRIKLALGNLLSVPVDSVLHSGDQDFVFVIKEGGTFEPRAVSTGFKTQEFVEIRSGIKEGETVATAANFLIDSESRLRSAMQGMAPK